MKNFTITIILFILLTSISHAAEVTLKWDANDEASLAGYKIHYGVVGVCGSTNEGNNFTEVIDVGNVTEYRMSNLDKGVYNFAVTAYDLDGNESDYSYIIIESLKMAKVKGFYININE